MKRVLGLSCYYHDAAVALLEDGRIRFALQEERLTRRKNDESFPKRSLRAALNQAGVELRDIDAVVYYEKPWIKFERILWTYLQNPGTGFSHFVRKTPDWLGRTLYLRANLTKALREVDPNFRNDRLFFSSHHLSHAASAFYPSPFEEAAFLTVDGVGEWATTSWGHGRGREIKIEKQINFPNSLGLLYSAFTSYCGFKVNSGEYKLMGLAPYGKPTRVDRILADLLELLPDGSFRLRAGAFDFFSDKSIANQALADIFGKPARRAEEGSPLDYADIAASVQKALEKALIHILNAQPGDTDRLCLAGGVALNCVANSEIRKQTRFKKIWVQPASGDAGSALGAALAYHHLGLEQPRAITDRDAMASSLLGPAYGENEIRSELDRDSLAYEKLPTEALVDAVADRLSKGETFGWFQGRVEFGPRALGSRSILADPRDATMQKRLNLQTKFRESFRPFAPLVLHEKAREWFEDAHDSPYMLFVFPVAEKHRGEIPAVTHVDFSARLQTVAREDHPLLHRVMSSFEAKTGCPVLVNTSFNVRGEPIVCTPRDALRCFFISDLDHLVLGDYWVTKEKNRERLSTLRSAALAEATTRFPSSD